MRLILIIIVVLFAVSLIFSRLIHIRTVYKNKQAARQYCKQKGFEYINAIAIDPNMRLHFTKNGITSWADFKTNDYFQITWINGTPVAIYKDILDQNRAISRLK